jgi:hypothetical protein
VGQQYSVTCECGLTQQVTGADAGSELPCQCGRTIAVPSLQRLRVSTGEPPVSAEVMLERLLLTKRLPEETHCLCCDTPTTDTACVTVACERPEVREPGWSLNPLALLFGWICLTRSYDSGEVGRDVSFRLPVRLCRGCGASLSPINVRDTLRKVTVYRQLLEKYPDAAISTISY